MEILEKVEQLKAELDSLRPFDGKAEARTMQKFRLDWNYHSNKIEGNSLTYGETKALLLFGITAQGKPLKDHFEITGHNEAINWVLDLVKGESALTEVFIRQLHVLLLKEDHYIDAITEDGGPTRRLVKVGAYKSMPNHVRTVTGETFFFATPEATPAKMEELVEWFRTESGKSDINPIILASLFHYRFIRIHPFDDGNGRVARILMNFILMQFGYPPVIIKTEDKENYYVVLQLADSDQMQPFIDFIAANLEHSVELMIRGAKGEDIEEPDDLDKEIALLKERAKSLGTTIELSKSKDVLLSVFEESIVPLIYKFIEVNEKFSDFYLTSRFLFFWDNALSEAPIGDLIANTIQRIKDVGDVNSASMQYEFINFRQTGFEDFNFSSRISLKFEFSNFRADLGNEVETYQRLYTHRLTEKEINQMTRALGSQHRKYIQDRIDAGIATEKRLAE